MTTPPPCAGRWELFDSTDVLDHREARELCNACPMLADCHDRLLAASKHVYGGPEYGPRGTWAGTLIGGPRTSARRAQAEEAMFSEEEAREAHAKYAAGFRDARTLVGERVYNRRSKRAQADRRRAA